MEEHRQARFIIETLNKAGFIAYYAGGWVRDYLLQHPSDDIDIATNAPPETIQALFPHTVPIGIAFGIILVIVEHHSYEVATFRSDMDYKDGRRPSQIAFTTAEEDAKRRDFTINGMFYDPLTEKIFDYVGGREDLQKKLIRAIGNPHERIKEDRLRMIRAIRLACRFRFAIDPSTQDAIHAHAKEVFPAVAIERIVQEMTKAQQFNVLPEMLLHLHEFGLLSPLFKTLTDVSLSALKEYLAPTYHYPASTPVVGFLLRLFPKSSLSEKQALCKLLKLPKTDFDFVTFLTFVETSVQKTLEDYDWAYLYANPLADLCLKIASLQGLTSEKEHENRRQHLQKAIQRIQTKDPVVKSEMLLQAGISPGPQMGQLLKKAEKISINEGIEDPEIILRKIVK